MKKFLISFFAVFGSSLLALSDLSCSTHLNWLMEYRWINDLYSDHLKNFFETKSFWIGLACNALAVLIEIFYPSSPKPVLKSYLTQLYRSLFDGEANKARITVFRISRGIRLWPRFFWNNVRCVFKHIKKGTLGYQFTSFPWIPWKKYVAIYARFGNPHQKGTMTIFKYPEGNDDVNGIASYVLMTMQKFSISLPNINTFDIEQFSDIDEIQHHQRKQIVQDYMKKSRMTSFSQLKSIHSKAQHIWATPIVGDDNEAWGVLVVDDVKSENSFNDPHVDQSLELASGIIFTILRTV